MVYQPVEDLLPKAGYSVYRLTVMASRRAQELASGQPKLVETNPSEKVATIALLEIKAGKVMTKDVADSLEKSKK